MSHTKNPKPHAFPVFTGDTIAPMIKEFFWSISLKQTLDLALGKPDCDTKSCLKKLLVNLVDECCTFILCNISKQGIRTREVDTILGNVVLTTFADTLEITGQVHCKSFDYFNELFLKYVKESLKSACSTHDPETSVVLPICWSDAMDSILPHALRLIEELLVCRCKEQCQTERKAAEDQQQRKENPGACSDVLNFQAEEKDTTKTPQNSETEKAKTCHTDRYGSKQFNVNLISDILEKLDSEVTTEETYDSNPVSENEESDLKMVDEFILEDLSNSTNEEDLISNERESAIKMVDEFILEDLSTSTNEEDLISNEKKRDIKMVDEFISEEFSDLTKATHLTLKENESSLEMMEDFIFEVLPKDREVKKSISDQHHLEIPGNLLDDLPPTENQESSDQAAPLPIAQQNNKADGVKMKENLQNYSNEQGNRDLPPPEDEETTVPSVENSNSQESTHSKCRQLVDAEQESVVTTKVAEPLPVAEKEDQKSSIMLLVNAVLIKAITKSRITCKYNHLQDIVERLSEKICAEVKVQDLKDIQSSLNNLSKDILRAVTKKLGCSKKDVLLLLGLNCSTIDEDFISICKKKIVKPAKKPSLIQRFWASITKTLPNKL